MTYLEIYLISCLISLILNGVLTWKEWRDYFPISIGNLILQGFLTILGPIGAILAIFSILEGGYINKFLRIVVFQRKDN